MPELSPIAMKMFEAAARLNENNPAKPFSTSELKSAVIRLGEKKKASIIPTDFCYNLWNEGLTKTDPDKEHAFLESVDHGWFRFLDFRCVYNGKMYHSPKGSHKRLVVGEWKNGVLKRIANGQADSKARYRRSKTARDFIIRLEHFAQIGDWSDAIDLSSVKDAREHQWQCIVQRRGQPRFRNAVLTAYKGRCLITGCNAQAALEAAHIIPYLGPMTNHPANGILLRADLHTLFDLHLLQIDPTSSTLAIKPELKGTPYEELDGVTVTLPNDSNAHLRLDALRVRWDTK